MKEKKLSLFIFIDALGWQILQRHPEFLKEQAPYRKELRTIFGYSSACDPSIISGLTPSEHLQWSSFYYSPETCPYPWLRYLRFLPSFLMDYHKVRHRLSQLIKWSCGFTGYFQLYNVPFQYLPYFDYAEKERIFAPGGLKRGKSIFDYFQERQFSYYVDDHGRSDQEKLLLLEKELKQSRPPFAYLLLGGLDGLMHGVGPHSPQVTEYLSEMDKKLKALLRFAEQYYEDISFHVFSDHGMHAVSGGYDLQREINELGLTFGKDYAAIYDSTMARFWFLNSKAREIIQQKLSCLQIGRIVPSEELKKLGVYFPDHMYGECIFLMHAPVMIAPSFMGRKAIAGMHGFHPNDPDSAASFCSNRPIPSELKRIEHIFGVLMEEAFPLDTQEFTKRCTSTSNSSKF